MFLSTFYNIYIDIISIFVIITISAMRNLHICMFNKPSEKGEDANGVI